MRNNDNSNASTGISRTRRRFLQTAAIGGAGMVAGCTGAFGGGSGEFPSDAFTAILPYSEGGGVDTWSRAIYPEFTDILGNDVEFRNVSGAGGVRGVGEAHGSEPDGYTHTVFSLPLVPLAWHSHEPDWDLAEMAPVGIFTQNVRLMLYASPDLGVEGPEELFELYRSGEITTFGSADQGALESAIAYQLRDNDEYDVPWEELVEYDGSGPMVQAVASGEVPTGIATDSAAQGSGYEDTVDFVCSLAASRSVIFDDVPSLDDAGYPGFENLAVYRMGMYTPPETPMERRQTLADGLEETLNSDDFQSWLDETGNRAGPFEGPERTKELLEGSVQTIGDNVDFDQLEG